MKLFKRSISILLMAAIGVTMLTFSVVAAPVSVMTGASVVAGSAQRNTSTLALKNLIINDNLVKWQPTNTAAVENHFAVIQLANPTKINTIKITGMRGMTSYSFDYSYDAIVTGSSILTKTFQPLDADGNNVAWTRIPEFTSPITVSDTTTDISPTHTFDAVTAKYIRLNVTTSASATRYVTQVEILYDESIDGKSFPTSEVYTINNESFDISNVSKTTDVGTFLSNFSTTAPDGSFSVVDSNDQEITEGYVSDQYRLKYTYDSQQAYYSIITGLAPIASAIAISGELSIGEKLSVLYDYSDPDGDEEGATIYSWKKSTSYNGTFVPIEGGSGKDYILTPNDIGYYLSVSVTPVDSDGMIGEEAKLLGTPMVGDLAYMKNATASQQSGVNEGKNVTNGIYESSWRTSTTVSSANVTIDFGVRTVFTQIKIVDIRNYAAVTSYSVEVSNDNSNWDTIISGSSLASANLDISTAPINKKYIRLSMANNSSLAVGVCKILVFRDITDNNVVFTKFNQPEAIPGQSATGKVVVYNETADLENFIVISTVISSSGVMLSADLHNPNEEISIAIPENAQGGSVNLYVFDSFSTIRPITTSNSIPIQ